MQLPNLKFAKDLRNFFFDVGIFLIIAVTSKGLRYIASVMVARYLGVVEYGKFALFIQSSGYAAVLIEIGLPSAIIFFCVRKKHNLDALLLAAAVSVAVCTFLLSIFLYVGLQSFSDYMASLDQYKDFTDGNALFFIFIYAFFLSSFNILLAGIRAQSRNLVYSFAFAMPGVLFFLFVVAFLFFSDLHLEAALSMLMLSCFVCVGALITYFLKGLKRAEFPQVKTYTAILSYGLKNYFTKILSTGLQVIPFIVLAIFEYDEVLGYYAAAMITASIFRMIGQSLSLFLTAKLSGEDETESLRFVVALSLFLAFGFAVLIPSISYFSDEIMVLVYGDDFLPAGELVSWLLIAVACEILIGIILRPFITRNVPLHFVQWLVYGVALAALIFGLASISVLEIDLFLRAVGQSLVLAGVTGLSLSVFAFCILARHREQSC